MLFFLTVRITMLRKLTLQRDLFCQLGKAHPELSIQSGELRNPDQILASDSTPTPPKPSTLRFLIFRYKRYSA